MHHCETTFFWTCRLRRVAVPAKLEENDRISHVSFHEPPKPTSDPRPKRVKEENDNEDRAGDGSTSSDDSPIYYESPSNLPSLPTHMKRG